MKKSFFIFTMILCLVCTSSIANESLESPWGITWGMNQEDYITQVKSEIGINAEKDDNTGLVASSGNAIKAVFGASASSMIAAFSEVKKDQDGKWYIDPLAGLQTITISYWEGITSFEMLLERASTNHSGQAISDFLFSTEDDSGKIFYTVDTNSGNLIEQLKHACATWERVELRIAWGNYSISFYMNEVYSVASADVNESWDIALKSYDHSETDPEPIPYIIQQ